MLEALAKHARSSGKWLLRRIMEDSLPLVTSHVITCDASPWGGGGILWVNSRPVEYTHFVWAEHTMKFLSAVRSNTCQTLFEFLTVFLCLLTFERSVVSCGVAVGGDNLSSLQNAIDCKSTRPAINLIGREIAWRKGLRNWRLVAFHFPKKHNTAADALSRLSAPVPLPRPDEALRGAHLRLPPAQTNAIWLARFDRPAVAE